MGNTSRKYRLEALGLALLFRHALLQEFQVRTDLHFDEIRRLNNFAKFAEVDAFGVSAVGHGNSRLIKSD
jgi:hypothetical protein